MKNKSLLSVIALLGALIALGCNSPITAPDANSAFGTLQVLVNDQEGQSEARTLVPYLGDVNYQIYYRTAYPVGEWVLSTETDIMLPAGNYDLNVYAVSGGNIIAKYESATAFSITGGKITPAPVKLVPYGREGEPGQQGVFHYAVDYSVIRSTCGAQGYLKLTPYFNPGGSSVFLYLENNNLVEKDSGKTNTDAENTNGKYDGNISLPAGIYTLEIRVTTNHSGSWPNGDVHTTTSGDSPSTLDNDNVDLYKTEIVYIYSGKTTSMNVNDYTFKLDDLTKMYFKGKVSWSDTGAVNGPYTATLRVYD